MARILLCHEFFWPDAAPYGSILKALGEHWTDEGHEVHVFTSRPDSDRSLGGLNFETEDHSTPLVVHRTRLPFSSKSRSGIARAANSIIFASKFVLFARRNKPIDLLMNSTMPPLFAGMAGSMASRLSGARWIYHLMDIFPEVISISKENRHSFVVRNLLALAGRVDSWACGKATRLVVLSNDMRSTLLNRTGDSIKASQLEVMPNFALPDWSKDSSTSSTDATVVPWKSTTSVKMVFAGNLGRFQGLEKLLSGFLSYRDGDADCELAFIGDGVISKELRKVANARSDIHFTGLLSRALADQSIKEADVCVVSLAAGVEKVAFPTKISSYLLHSKPLLAIGKPGSSLEQLVEENNVGCFADIDSQSSIASAITKCVSEENRTEWKNSALEFGQRYRPEHMFRFWDNLLTKLLSTNDTLREAEVNR